MGVDRNPRPLSLNLVSARVWIDANGAGNAGAKHRASHSAGVADATADLPSLDASAQPQRVPLQKVLDDELESPLSYQDFYDFLCREHSEENLEFYMAVKEYTRLASTVPAELLVPSKDGGAAADDGQPARPELVPLTSALDSILATFFTSDGEKELNVPAKIASHVVQAIWRDQDFRPAVFDAAVENVCTMLRLSSFPSFCRSVGVSPLTSTMVAAAVSAGAPTAGGTGLAGETPKEGATGLARRTSSTAKSVVLRQVLENKLPSPYSFQDFYDFLCKEHSEENADFYLDMQKYNELANNVPAEFLLSQDSPSSGTPPQELSKLTDHLDEILRKYFVDDAEKELNITHKMRSTLLAAIKERGDLRPEVFKAVLDHVVVVIEFSSFPNFRKQVAAATGVKAEDASERLSRRTSGMSVQSVPPSDRSSIVKSPTAVSAISEMAASPSTPASTTSSTKSKSSITLQQVLDNQLEPPLSYKDFYEFLRNEHSEENMEFYNAYQSYQALYAALPPDLLPILSAAPTTPPTPRPQLVQTLHDALNKILQDHFTPDADMELNVPAKVIRKLLEETGYVPGQESVSESERTRKRYDPAVFAGVLEVVLTMMRLSSLPSFLKAAKTQSPTQS